MKTMLGIAAAPAALLVIAGVSFAAGPPPWAYGFTTPPPAPGSAPAAAPAPAPAAQPDTSIKTIPGSTGQFTRAQISDRYGPADWFPNDHPQMPDVVAHGKKPEVYACSLCHYPNGKGRPENASVVGFSTAYFIQTMHDFRDGNRRSADPRKTNTNLMVQFAKNMTEDEIKAAAEYFGAMKWTPWIKVEEASMVPKTRIAGGMFLTLEEGGKEPIGNRIIETPVSVEDTEVLRNPHSGFIAYVPPGSLKKGEALVNNGAGKTTKCATCHGDGLKGLGPVPGLAGRSPSYLMRQMYDMQQGFRKGAWTELMKPVVANLSEGDMLAIAAYAASLKP
jgi:cytochrome c553